MTRGLLGYNPTKSASKLVVQVKGETLMQVPETAEGFRATTGTLRSLEGGEHVSFQTFPLPYETPVSQLLINLRMRMIEAEIREELETMHTNVEAVTQLWLKRRDQDSERNSP